MTRREICALSLSLMGAVLVPAHLLSQVQATRVGTALAVGAPGAWDEGLIGGCDVVKLGSTYHLVYSACPFPYPEAIDHFATRAIGATSYDSEGSEGPLAFVNAVEPVLRWDLGGITCPTVVYRADAKDGYPWRMWFTAGTEAMSSFDIRSAVSRDGVRWEFVDGPVLTADTAWEAGFLANPSVVFDGETYWMWYDAGPLSGEVSNIGVATWTDGVEWHKCADNPVLGLGGAEGSAQVWGADVVRDESTGVFEMWYCAYSSTSSGIAYATSLDGVRWTSPGTVSIDWEPWQPMHPNVLKEGDRYHLWYVTWRDPSSAFTELVYATSDRTLPLASFTAEVEGDRVTLDASRTSPPPGCTIASYEWDFGDGTTGEAMTAERTYAPGWHIVTLTVRDSCGGIASNQRRIVVGCPPGDVAPWTAVDIGEPRFPGSSSRQGDCFEVCAGGKLLGGTSDQLHFVWEEISGDFSRTLRIEAMDGSESGAQLGLMARESLDADAALAAASIRRARIGGERFRWDGRPTSGASIAGTNDSTVAAPPGWVRLERKGDELIGWYSTDGAAWTEYPARRTLGGSPGALLVGIFGIGREPTDGRSAFESLRGRACLEGAAPRFIRGGANEDGAVDLSDAVAILGYLFLGGSVDCLDAGDVDDDGEVLITDPIALLNHLFLGGPPPAAPFAECGEDPSEDELGCESFAGCP
jgi:predicted GH43/DUF377 family glycosyl hydrolase